jgi:hypothetical protein
MAKEQETPAFFSVLVNECGVMSDPNSPARRAAFRSLKGGSSWRPTAAQRRYLMRAIGQAGAKLPLFDRNGREIDRKTIESCVDKGWAEPWFDNPTQRAWLVCKLTPAGYAVLGQRPPANDYKS